MDIDTRDADNQFLGTRSRHRHNLYLSFAPILSQSVAICILALHSYSPSYIDVSSGFVNMAPHDPSTPSKLGRTHSRQISSEAGTEFGTPESSFPTDSPTVADSTRMVGLGLSTPKLEGAGTPNMVEGGGDVFGNGQRVDLTDRDHALDEVDRFLNEADEDDLETRDSSFDMSKGRIELNMPNPRRAGSSSSSFAQSPGSHASDPLLEVLDNDEDEDDEGMEMFEDGDEEDLDPEQPLVGHRSGARRGRRRWEGGERRKESGLFEVSHPS